MIALGVIVAVLAMLLTPGVLDISAIVNAGQLPDQQSFAAATTIEKAGSHSVEFLSQLLEKANIRF